MTATAPHLLFREARERSGLSQEEVAARSGISASSIWDIETVEGEITGCHSPKDLLQLCQIIGIRPTELFGAISEPPISASELVERIQEECRTSGTTLKQFENKVGWRLTPCVESPNRLLEDMTVDGLQWLCKELRIDWRRVLLNL